jgi:ApbE superfamily uncharacterized protein (UPF0280 family)
MYQPRTYRHRLKGNGLVSFNVTVKETDLHISALRNLKSKAHRLVVKYRDALERYIEKCPTFITSLIPVPDDDSAPRIVRAMIESAQKTNVGPMASVAGAISEFVGIELLAFSPEIILENGGDIFLKTLGRKTVGIHAGESPLNGKINLEIDGGDTPLGICASSGTIGHSLSYGKADAVVILAKSTTLADAAATAIGNVINQADDISKGIEIAQGIDGLKGLLIIKDDTMGLWGEVKIC